MRPQPLADLIGPCLGPSLAAQGFAAADVIVAWPEIVGERLAAFSQPLRLERRRPRDPDAPREPGTLVVRVESAFALDLQHLAPVVIERVNAHYGWRCVGRLVLKQGPVRRAEKHRPAPPPLSEGARSRVAAAVAPVASDTLRAALDRLGAAVLARQGTTP
jgi:hypothetical protein